jgi:hypothetical protein
VDYRGLSVAISAKMTLNVIDIVINLTLLIDCNDRPKFIIIIVERLKILLKRYNFN